MEAALVTFCDRPRFLRLMGLPVGRWLLGGIFSLVIASAGCAADYQFGVRITKSPSNPLLGGDTNAFLWVPPKAERLRAVLLAPANIIERRVCEDPVIRREAAKDGIAILYFQAGWGKGLTDAQVAAFVQTLLDRLAESSGYAELKTVAWIPVGHSGNSKFCQSILRARPDHVVAAVVIKGAMPTVGPEGSTVGLVGIPILNFVGEFEEVMPPGRVRDGWWPELMKRLAVVRAVAPQSLISGVLDRGCGHISWQPDMSEFAALFLGKAMSARMPAADGSLKPVSYGQGWLTDPLRQHPPAPVGKYAGDPLKAFWIFDEEMVRAWERAMDVDLGKKDQMLAFVVDGKVAPWWPGWVVQEIPFRPLADGESFSVAATFRDAVPEIFADSGTKLGHSSNGPITYRVVGWAGNIEQSGPDTFRVRFDREGVNGRTLHVVIAAVHPGDAEYRRTMAAAHFNLPATNPGTPQKIDFPPLPDVPATTREVPLRAKVDSGLEPDYYVSWGPAEVVGDTLRITEIPVRARFPIEVRVTAYQWGRAVDPKIATASPVFRTFKITGP